MELYEFNTLDLDLKANFLWDEASFLVAIREPHTSYLLYQTKHFYAEIVLSGLQVTEIRGFKQGQHLNKYLDKMNIQALL